MEIKLKKTLLVGTAVATLLPLATPQRAHAEDLLAGARSSMLQGHFREAEIQLKKALQQNPRDPAARFQLAQLDLDLTNFTGAEAEVRRAMADGYERAPAVALLARTYLYSQRHKEMIPEMDAIASDPASTNQVKAVAISSKAIAMAATDRKTEAARTLAAAKAADPKSAYPWLAEEEIARTAGDMAKATAAVREASTIDPANIEVLTRLGRDREITDDRAGARAAYESVLAISPSNAVARLGIIGLTIRANDVDEAQRLVTKYIQESPDDQRGMYFDAILASKASEWPRANADLARSVGVIAALPTGYLLLAIVKDAVNQPDQAWEAIRKYAARKPDDNEIGGYLARYAEKAGHPDAARQAIADAVKSGNAGPQTLNVAATLAMRSGRMSEAVALFQQALTKDPTNTRTMDHLADAQIAIGDTAGAVDTLDRSTTVDPKQEDAQIKLIYALSATGRMREARTALATYAARPDASAEKAAILEATIDADEKNPTAAKKAIEAFLVGKPDSMAALSTLARLQVGTGEEDAAAGTMRRMLSFQPKNHDVAVSLAQLLNKQKKPADAQAVLDRTQAEADNAPQSALLLATVALNQGRPKDAISMLDRAKAPDRAKPEAGPMGVAMTTLRSQAQQANGDDAAAIATQQKALAAMPSDDRTRLRLVGLLVKAKDFKAARKVMQDGLDQKPHDRTLIEADVKLYELDGKDAAMAEADRLIAAGMYVPEARIVKAELLDSMNRHGDATTLYDGMLRASPTHQVVMTAATSSIAAGDLERATTILHAWTEANPDDLDAIRTEANIYMRLGRYAEAKTKLDAALSVEPNDAPTINNLAWAEMRLGNGDGALMMARRAFKAAPNPHTADTLAWMQTVSLKPGEKPSDETVALARRATEMLPDAAGVRYHTGAILMRAGDTDEGRKMVQAAIATTQQFDGLEDAKKLVSTTK